MLDSILKYKNVDPIYAKYIIRRKAGVLLSKVGKVSKEVLEIKSKMKDKDYLSVGLAVMSAASAIVDNFLNISDNATNILADIGTQQIFPNIEEFIRDILKQMRTPMNYFWRDSSKDSDVIEEYDLGSTKVYFVVEGNSYVEGVYVRDPSAFLKEMSVRIENHFGPLLLLENSSRGVNKWERSLKISSIVGSNDVYINNNQIDEDDLADSVKRFFSMNLNRSLLFYGPPGSGKTTLAVRLTKNLGGKILVLDGKSLKGRESISLMNAIDIVDPSIILLDDLDKISSMSTLMGDIERLNRTFNERGRLIIATVNSLSKVPAPLRRPGRFDQAIEFAEPDKSVREQVLAGYAKQFKIVLSQEDINSLAELTEGMTQAYLREIVLRTSIIGLSKMASHIEQMKHISSLADKSKDESVIDDDDEF